MALIASLDTVLPADCIEWFPHQASAGSTRVPFVVATYKLDEETRTKYGAIKFLSLEQSAAPDTALAWDVLTEHVIETAAVFDARWADTPAEDGSGTLAFCTSGGGVHLTRWRPDHSLPAIVASTIITHGAGTTGADSARSCDDPSSMDALSVCWPTGSLPGGLAVSSSAGSLHTITARDSSLVQTHSWRAHTHIGIPGSVGAEVWTVAARPSAHWELWSGGDDARMKGWDTRTDCASPTFVNASHSAGVCSIAFHPSNENMAVSGSYDEHIRVWDVRAPGKPLTSCRLGGGVWKLRWCKDADHADVCAAACMHAGFRVVRVAEGSHAVEVLSSYTGHASLAYGVDWMPSAAAQALALTAPGTLPPLGTCSFYDHLLHVWSPHLRQEATEH